jgi:hypothetical protein
MTFNIELLGTHIEASLSISKSKIFIHMEADEAIPVPDLRNTMLTLAGNVINYACFFYVSGISYELDSITQLGNRSTYVWGVEGHVFDDPSDLDNKLTFKSHPSGDKLDMSPALMNSPHLNRATFELKNSIRYPDFTALHCRLAIEAIRNAFDPDDENTGWQNLRKYLNIDRVTIESFKDIATKQRHGKNEAQTWAQRRACMQIAWEIVYRYTNFLKSGVQHALGAPTLLVH